MTWILNSRKFGKPQNPPTQYNHREGTTTPSLSSVLSNGYKDRLKMPLKPFFFINFEKHFCQFLQLEFWFFFNRHRAFPFLVFKILRRQVVAVKVNRSAYPEIDRKLTTKINLFYLTKSLFFYWPYNTFQNYCIYEWLISKYSCTITVVIPMQGTCDWSACILKI